MSVLYRHVEGRGWAEVDDAIPDYIPGPEWRLATFPEHVRYFFTKARFSWLDFVAINIIAWVVLSLIKS